MSANGVDAAVVRRVGTAFGLALVAWVAAANAQPAVMLHGSAVSVQSRGQPLAAVLRALADSTGIVVKGADTLSQIVRWDLDRVNVADGLRRLLDGQNYLLIEGAAGQPTRVIVVGSEHETGPAPGVSPVPSRRPPPSATATASLDPESRIEAIERAGEQDDPQGDDMIRRALTDPNDAVRAVAHEAMRARQARGTSGTRSASALTGLGSGR